MALGKYDSRRHTVVCPICCTRIFKDRGAYAAHMVASHNATDTVFLDTGIRGVGRYLRAGAVAGLDDRFREEEVLHWCGCDSTPSDFGHLIDDHGVEAGP